MVKGADINRRDKEGITPLLLAAKFAKDMELIDLFLDNKKVDLHYCDQLEQNVIAYAEKNIYGMRTKIINRVKKIDYEILEQYNLVKLTKSEMQHISIWKSLTRKLHDYFDISSPWFQPLSALIAPVMKNNQMKLFHTSRLLTINE